MRTDGADGRWVLGSGGGAVAVFGTFQEAGCSLQEHVPGLCSERSCYLVGNSARQAGLRLESSCTIHNCYSYCLLLSLLRSYRPARTAYRTSLCGTSTGTGRIPTLSTVRNDNATSAKGFTDTSLPIPGPNVPQYSYYLVCFFYNHNIELCQRALQRDTIIFC